MSLRSRIPNCLAVVLLAALISEAPLACSVSPDYLVPSVAERTIVATHVVLSDGYTASGHVRVARWLKGRGPREISVIDHSPCNIRPSETGKSIVFLRKGASDAYELLSYGLWSGSTAATPEALEEIYAVMELGLEDYLRRKGASLRIRGIFKIEGTNEWQAVLELRGTGETFRRSAGEVIHESTAKVIHIDASSVKIEMVTRERAGMTSPVIVDLELAQ